MSRGRVPQSFRPGDFPQLLCQEIDISVQPLLTFAKRHRAFRRERGAARIVSVLSLQQSTVRLLPSVPKSPANLRL